jgi:hypothetical protein
MTNAVRTSAQTDAWAAIEKEKRFDRFVRKACVTAWAVTLGLLILFGIGSAVAAVQMVKLIAAAGMPWMSLIGPVMPFLGALWTVCLLVATLTTVGVFLRLRTSSLSEIQLRLSALEEMLAARGETR